MLTVVIDLHKLQSLHKNWTHYQLGQTHPQMKVGQIVEQELEQVIHPKLLVGYQHFSVDYQLDAVKVEAVMVVMKLGFE
jgi:hypothetical protein